MDWNCTLTEERLSDVLDRTISADESAAFSSHVAGCERCKRLMDQVSGVTLRVRQLPMISEPPFLASKIIAATRETPAQQPGAKRWFGWSPAFWQTRFAMGLVTVAATFFIVFHAMSGGEPGKLQLSAAGLFHGANRRAHLTYAKGVKFVNDLRVVYEFQSRLSSQPEPALEPTPPPQEKRPDSDARPKTQTIPPANRRMLRGAAAFAILMINNQTRNALEETPRSLP